MNFKRIKLSKVNKSKTNPNLKLEINEPSNNQKRSKFV